MMIKTVFVCRICLGGGREGRPKQSIFIAVLPSNGNGPPNPSSALPLFCMPCLLPMTMPCAHAQHFHPFWDGIYVNRKRTSLLCTVLPENRCGLSGTVRDEIYNIITIQNSTLICSGLFSFLSFCAVNEAVPLRGVNFSRAAVPTFHVMYAMLCHSLRCNTNLSLALALVGGAIYSFPAVYKRCTHVVKEFRFSHASQLHKRQAQVQICTEILKIVRCDLVDLLGWLIRNSVPPIYPLILYSSLIR